MKQDPGDLNELTKLKENDGAVKAERRLLPNVNWVVKFQALESKICRSHLLQELVFVYFFSWNFDRGANES